MDLHVVVQLNTGVTARASGLGMQAMQSRFTVFTNNAANPGLCGQHGGVIKVCMPMSST